MASVGVLTAKLELDSSSFTKGAASAANQAKDLGKQMTGLGTAMTAGLTVPILAIGAALLKVATDFDDAFDRIRIGTGATGAALAGLEQSFRNVVADVPASFEAASQALTQLAQRTTLTGAALEELTKQELELSRMTGEELGPQIDATARLFTNWAGEIESPSAALDFLFKVSQKTGIGVTELAQTMTSAGAPLRALGFGFEQSAVLMGSFDKAGVDAGKATMALTKALTEMAERGIKDPAAAFTQLIEKIKTSTSETDALRIATELFGSRAAVQMVDAIRKGRFEIEGLTKGLKDSQEGILTTAAYTNDYSENLQILANRVKLAAEPLAKEFFEAINRLIPTFTSAISKVTALITWFTNLSGPTKTATAVILGLAAVAGPIAVMAGSVIRSLGSIGVAMTTLKGTASSLLTMLGGIRGAVRLVGQSMDTEDIGRRVINNTGLGKAVQEFKNAQMAAAGFTIEAEKASRELTVLDAVGGDLASHMKELDFIAGKTGATIEQTGTKGTKTGEDLKGLGEKAGKGGAAGGVSTLAAALENLNKWTATVNPNLQFTEEILKSMSCSGRASVLSLSAAFVTLKNSIALMGAEMAGLQKINANVEAAFYTLIQRSREMRETIVPIITVVGDLQKSFDGIRLSVEKLPPMFNGVADAVKQSFERSAKAAAELAEKMKQSIQRIKSDWGEGLGSLVIAIGKMTGASLDTVTQWSSDIAGVIHTLPGKFGETARGILRTVDQWVAFANSILKILNRLNDQIPAALDQIGKAVQKTSTTTAGQKASASNDWAVFMEGITKEIKKGGEDGEEEASQAAAKITAIMSGVSTFIGTRRQGKAVGVLGGAMAGATIGMAFGGPLGAGIGAGIGAIAGLFGSGKSAAQKAEEERQKKQMAMDMEKQAIDITSAAIDSMKKALDMFKDLADHVDVPKAAIKSFFKTLEKVTKEFLTLAGKFAKDNMEAAKVFAESMGPVIVLMAGALEAFTSLRFYTSIPERAIQAMATDLGRAAEAMGAVAIAIEDNIEKKAKRFSERVMPVVELIAGAFEAFQTLNEYKGVMAATFTSFFADVSVAVNMMGELADDLSRNFLNKAKVYAERIGSIVQAIGTSVTALTSLRTYEAVPQAAFAALEHDIMAALAMIDRLVIAGEHYLDRAITFQHLMEAVAGALSAGAGALRSVAGATSSGSPGLDAIRMAPASTEGGGGGASGTVINVGGLSYTGINPAAQRVIDSVQELLGQSGLPTTSRAY